MKLRPILLMPILSLTLPVAALADSTHFTLVNNTDTDILLINSQSDCVGSNASYPLNYDSGATVVYSHSAKSLGYYWSGDPNSCPNAGLTLDIAYKNNPNEIKIFTDHKHSAYEFYNQGFQILQTGNPGHNLPINIVSHADDNHYTITLS
ncbi:hypothetical protein [Facilibium subflavum]|uniref:hypothetical protein n=1 Tax=Facilibium subflavum TaxID=2219058 RepID=UPI000E65A4F3|nr:hypothetical protein [Facilibium subflavum]